jgi:hypothetical protein
MAPYEDVFNFTPLFLRMYSATFATFATKKRLKVAKKIDTK